MPDLTLAVIIPSSLKTPQLPFLRRCLISIRAAARTQTNAKLHVQLFVVSTWAASRSLCAQHPDVNFLLADSGAGFGELNNLAIEVLRKKKQKPNWVLLLNDDAFLEHDFFEKLFLLEKKNKRNEQPAGYVPLIREARDQKQIDAFGVEYFRSGYAKNNRELKNPTTLATAGCLLLRWSFVERFLKAYGFFFSPLYYYYLEDVDLSLRIRMFGGQLQPAKELVAYHFGSTSSGGKRNSFALYQTYRNVLWVMICCWPAQSLKRNVLSILLVQCWLIWYGTLNCGLLTFPRIWRETFTALPRLLSYRQKTLAVYKNPAEFAQLLSPFAFRTFHNRTVRSL